MKPLTLHGYFLPNYIPGLTQEQRQALRQEKEMVTQSFGTVEEVTVKSVIWVTVDHYRIFIADPEAYIPGTSVALTNMQMLNKWREQ